MLLRQLIRIGSFTACRSDLYTASESDMRRLGKLPDHFEYTVAMFFLLAVWLQPALAQDAAQKPVEKAAAKSADKTGAPEKAVNPAQIELLETKVRFESNGDSRKEVHALVKINNELGVRQFAKLNFDYNRSFESIEIPLMHITHTSGGTADILPSAITDQPNPAVVSAPAYQDVRVKSVRILGLEPGDTLEYRVITTVSHHPLAPDFWLDHTFDRTGVVSEERFEIDVPASLFEVPPGTPNTYKGPQIQISPATPEISKEYTGEGEEARLRYKWKLTSQGSVASLGLKSDESSQPHVIVSTFSWWPRLAMRLKFLLTAYDGLGVKAKLDAKSMQIASARAKDEAPEEALYRFVSEKIRTVDLPLGSTGFRVRSPLEVISTGYGTPEDKAALFLALLPSMLPPRHFALCIGSRLPEKLLPRPTLFTHILAAVDEGNKRVYLDLATDVAPFGMIPLSLRSTTVLMLNHPNRGFLSVDDADLWHVIPTELPFASTQRVNVDAILGADGKLSGKVHYSMRGDNELLLRVAFHQTPKEKWKELAQLLSITDGFRGQVTSVNASDPYATKGPFTLEYEIEQPKFVNWSKKTVRIPALLPQIGLPDPPARPAAGAATSPIDLGTPLEVETQMTLRLPAGTAAHTPTGTSVQRDYATFSSQYSAKGLTISASRHIQFLLREVPATRAVDYNAFLRAVQNDEAQDFTLEPTNVAAPGAKPAEAKSPPSNKPADPKP